MKKFIALLFILFTLSFSLNNIIVLADTEPQTFSEGIYSVADLNLKAGVPYNVQNLAPYKAYVILFDGEPRLQQYMRLEESSAPYYIKPFKADSKFVIIGKGQISFTQANLDGQ